MSTWEIEGDFAQKLSRAWALLPDYGGYSFSLPRLRLFNASVGFVQRLGHICSTPRPQTPIATKKGDPARRTLSGDGLKGTKKNLEIQTTILIYIYNEGNYSSYKQQEAAPRQQQDDGEIAGTHRKR